MSKSHSNELIYVETKNIGDLIQNKLVCKYCGLFNSYQIDDEMKSEFINEKLTYLHKSQCAEIKKLEVLTLMMGCGNKESPVSLVDENIFRMIFEFIKK